MCGIVGIVESDLNRPVAPEELARMVRMLHHRGPDEEGSVTLSGVGLGMRRLSIVDLTGGQQPFRNEADSIQLVANGEIYNFPGLRAELESQGHTFRSRSDIEVLVQAYEEWGEDFLTRLRGMFALALWDGRSRTLLAARDRAADQRPVLGDPRFGRGPSPVPHGSASVDEKQRLVPGGSWLVASGQ